MTLLIDVSGKKFGRLTAIKYEVTRKKDKYSTLWFCKCDCGEMVWVLRESITSGKTKSCGCLHSELTAKRNFRHGLRDRPEYSVWLVMLDRCRNPKNKSYPRYGKRGIFVCKRWYKFVNFFEDMGPRPKGNIRHTIERIDNDGPYSPANCRWATYKEQADNKRNTILITIDGETNSLTKWCAKHGLSKATYWDRKYAGWSDKKAITTPPMNRGNRAISNKRLGIIS